MKKLITLSIIAFSSFICNAQNFFTDGLFGNNGYSYSTQLGAIEGRSENLFKQPDGKFLLCGYIYDIGCNCYYNVMFRTDECCLLYTSPSPRDRTRSRMPSSA